MSDLDKLFKQLIRISSDEAFNQLSSSNSIYLEMLNNIEILQKEILNCLQEHNKYLLFRLEETVSRQVSVISEEMYKEGLIDGIKISKVFDKLRK